MPPAPIIVLIINADDGPEPVHQSIEEMDPIVDKYSPSGFCLREIKTGSSLPVIRAAVLAIVTLQPAKQPFLKNRTQDQSTGLEAPVHAHSQHQVFFRRQFAASARIR